MTPKPSPELALYLALGKSTHGNEDQARALLARGVQATFQPPGADGWTTRMQCAHYRPHLLSLLRGHPHMNLSDAAIDGDLDAVARFLDRGASPDQLDAYRQNWPLRYAARGGHLEVVELLLARGARLAPDDAKPWNSPLLGALTGGHTHVADQLWAHGARFCGSGLWRLLDYAVKHHAPDISLAWILEHDLDSRPDTALHTAAHYGLDASLAYLLAHGAHVDAVQHGRVPLMTAAYFNALAKVRLLLDAHADLHATDPRGYTAMHYAICTRDIDDEPFDYQPADLERPVAALLRAAGLPVPARRAGPA